MSLHTEYHKGPWRFVLDPMYISLEADIEPLIPDASGATMDITMWLVEAWAGYAFTENWEVLGGVRYQDQDMKLSGLPNPPFPSSARSSDNWSDWFAGLRFNAALGDKWVVTWRGDIAFAGDSDSSYNMEIFFNRRIGETKALNIGYRILEDDYINEGVYGWDMVQQGPVIGYTWTF